MPHSQQPLAGFIGALVVTITAGVAAPSLAAVAPYPTRPIRLVEPYAPGGGADALARTLAPKLSESMGQQWVVDNRAGASGNMGTEIIATARPDGYTVGLVLSLTLVANPSLYEKLPFNVEKDLQPVTKLAASDYLLVVHPSVRANSVKEFIAVVKAQPGKLNYASAGNGSSSHLTTEMFKNRVGVDLVHIPYKGGGPATAAILAGEAQVLVVAAAAAMPYVRAGRLRALAVTGAKRSQIAPDLPTIAESGVPEFDVTGWYGLVVPAKTPAAIVRRLYDEALKALERPDVKEALGRQGQEIVISHSPQDFAAQIKRETAEWATVIKSAGVKGD